MIEQTNLVISKWSYTAPVIAVEDDEQLTGRISLSVMKKSTATKKGIACRFSCEFFFEDQVILEYEAADSYVIDHQDIIDLNEVQTMVGNSYNKFAEKFDFRKLGTVLQNKAMVPFNEKIYDLNFILPLLNKQPTE